MGTLGSRKGRPFHDTTPWESRRALRHYRDQWIPTACRRRAARPEPELLKKCRALKLLDRPLRNVDRDVHTKRNKATVPSFNACAHRADRYCAALSASLYSSSNIYSTCNLALAHQGISHAAHKQPAMQPDREDVAVYNHGHD